MAKTKKVTDVKEKKVTTAKKDEIKSTSKTKKITPKKKKVEKTKPKEEKIISTPINIKEAALKETPLNQIEGKTEKFFEVDIDTDPVENTQVIRIREAIRPIHKEKKVRLSKKYKDVDNDFADLTKDNTAGRFVLILGIIVLFVVLLPTIARTINKNFILDNEYIPYRPQEEKEKNKEQEIEKKPAMTEVEALEYLKSQKLDFLGIEKPIDELAVEFGKEPIEINAVNSYIINLYTIIEEERAYLTSFAVALDKSNIFAIGEDGKYTKLEKSVKQLEEEE